ncbi:MAG: methionine--tRNA ligase [Leptolyngbya sp. UWPOB_LEPTO1]|uniref:methionine--tRNA ligase n=1 Tax=Leptolyngbya sp. UWPOB_LEPTO1 TaxID=2815653 RepID=UPI001ACC56BB|nr:methionine--tRNA ligase [Leptolyngbya sp. UWPOB_LEPTO1]MBN8560887.1 methionine--tRNA ligase [Leptolyngbya sp. UWPOB_LEPTO1]
MNFQPTENSTFSLTTPLYYVNDSPHIGSAYPTIAADALARFQRLRGRSVRFVTGSDEHGQKIQRTAEALGRTPQEHCDLVVESFKNLWAQLDVKYDRFIRTTDEPHAAIVKEFFQRVWENGDIYLSQQKGWYCVACEEFKEERDLLENKHCPIHVNKPVEWRDEENYFFRLSKYQEKLEKLYAEVPEFIQPDIRRNEVLSFVSQGLRDFSISRVNFDWGFPVPNDPNHTIYVWFDALLGYITALLEPDQAPTLENAISEWYPFNVHIIGKDILRFHAVYFPAMLMSAGLPLPDRIFGHGFLVQDGVKMGKSAGNAIDPVALVERYGVDAFRYYFLKGIEFGRDGVFDEVRFVDLCNADLADNFGNLLNRALGLIHKNSGGVVPEAEIAIDHPLRSIAEGLEDRVAQAYEALRFDTACEETLTLLRAGNKYINEQAPWSLYKQGKPQEAEQVLYAVLESVRLAAYLLAPIVPHTSTAVYQQLGFSIDFNNSSLIDVSTSFPNQARWGILRAKQQLQKPQPVFQKLELPIEGSS